MIKPYRKKSVRALPLFVMLLALSLGLSAADVQSLDRPGIDIDSNSRSDAFSFKLRAGYFRPTESTFKNIYGDGWMGEGEVNVRIFSFIEFWLIGSYYNAAGNLPFSEERTRITTTRLGGGIKFRVSLGIFNPYIAAAPVVYIYRESNPIGTVKGNGGGYIGQVGFFIDVYKGLLFDLSVSYAQCYVKPQNIRADLGGLQAGIAIGYSF